MMMIIIIIIHHHDDDNVGDDDSGVDGGDDNDDDELQIFYETNSLVRLHFPNAAPLMFFFFENFNSLSCQNVPNQSHHSYFYCSVPADFKFTCKVDRIKCFVMLCYYVFCNNPIVFFCLLVTILL